MAEFNISRFKYVWRGPWANGISFAQDDIAAVGGKIYVCLIGHISSLATFDDDLNAINQYGNPEPRWILMAEGQRWRGTWATSTKYETSEIVKYGATLYICNAGHTSAVLSTTGLTADIEKWTFIARTFDFRANWVSGRKYYIGDIAKYNGQTYLTTAEHTASTATAGLEEDIANWILINRSDNWRTVWNPSTRYIEDDVVSHGAIVYRCIAGHTSAASVNLGLIADIGNWEVVLSDVRYRGNWQSAVQYYPNDIVTRGSSLLKTNLISNQAVFRESDWELYIPGTGYEQLWTAVSTYDIGDMVLYGGYTYRCLLQNNQGVIPSENDAVWALVSTSYNYRNEWQSNTLYKSGDVVREGGNVYVAIQDTGSYPEELPRIVSYTVTTRATGTGTKFFINNVETPNLYLVSGSTYIFDQTDSTNNTDPMYFSTVMDGNFSSSYSFLTTGVEYKLDNNVVTPETYISDFASATSRIITVTADITQGTFYPVSNSTTGAYNFSEIRTTASSVSWNAIITGKAWKRNWNVDTYYALGDVITYAGTMYYCVSPHIPNTLPAITGNTPKDNTGTYWELLIQGSPTNVLVDVGDMKTRASNADYYLQLGEPGQTAKVDLNGLVSWGDFQVIPKTYFVSPRGNDVNGLGTEGAPFFSIKKACEYIQEDVLARSPGTIFVKTGTYEEILPIVVPRGVAIVGDELRSTVIKPAFGYETSDMFYMSNGSGLRNATLQGLSGTLGDQNEYFTRRPSAGAYVSLNPGTDKDDESAWIDSKSPYVQNVSAFGTGCIGMKVDGDLHNGGYKSMVANDFTQILSDGIGYWVNTDGRSELVSVFTYYCHIGYLATAGGKIRATNGNNSYGDFGSVAEGVNPTEQAITAQIDNRTQDAQVAEVYADQDGEIIGASYSHAGQSYTSASFDVLGSGSGADLRVNSTRNQSISEIRLLEGEDSGSVGGFNFRRIENNAQIGSPSSITLSGSEQIEDTSYIGMNIFIKAGNGTGQWGQISSYDPITKVASIQNMYGQTGWNTIIAGKPISSLLDGTTRYVIEPRFTVSEPTYEPVIQTTGSFKTLGCAASNGSTTIICATSSNIVSYSTNGSSWINASLPATGDWIGAVWTGNKFIAISRLGLSAQSNDGINWSSANIPTHNFTNIKRSNSTIIITATGTQNVIISNDSGASWNTVDTGVLGGFDFVATDTDRWVIATTEGVAYQSIDNGLNWSIIPNLLTGLTNYEITDLDGGNRAFIACAKHTLGTLPSKPIVSRNAKNKDLDFNQGANFKSSQVDPSATSVGNWKISANGSLFVAIANNGIVNVSQDAINWKATAPIGGQVVGKVQYISYNNNGVVYDGWILCNSTSSSDLQMLKYGATCIARPNIASRKVKNFYILNPGSNYQTPPTGILYDTFATTDASYQFRIENGVLTQPNLYNTGTLYFRQSATVTGDGFADIFPVAGIIKIKNLLRIPGPGDAIVIGGNNTQYYIQKITEVLGAEPELTATLQITPILDVNESPGHNTYVEIRQNFSQVRLTGHDFLDVGSGDFTDTAYPLRYTEGFTSENIARQERETVGSGGGRVFYTSTDQDGNFRVGELFKVDQATGVVTISASQFDLSGLDELRIGGIILGGTNAVIREFSTDKTFIANSDNIIPTQRAIGAYITSRISGGGSNINANALLTSQLQIDGNGINMNANATVDGLVFDAPVYFTSYSGLWIMSQLFTAP
jgi:hypothetical protein